MTSFSLDSNRFWIGLGSVVAQCFLSLIGIVLMPLRGKPAYKYIVQTLAAFAVGALLGNAIINLIPQAIDAGHGHDKCEHHKTTSVSSTNFPLVYSLPEVNSTLLNQNHESFNNNFTAQSHRVNLLLNGSVIKTTETVADETETRDHTSLYRMLVTLAAILVFFSYHSLTQQHARAHVHEEPPPAAADAVIIHNNKTTHTALCPAELGQQNVLEKTNRIYPAVERCCNSSSTEPAVVSNSARTKLSSVALVVEKPNSCCCGSTTFRNISRRAYMVLLGDAIHNFADGVATAAAFAAGNDQGITTSIAIVCHETAHEVGDFAILLHSGMSFGGALFFNFLSSMSAIAGYLTGAVIVGSVHQDSFILWILALTAGIFLYIALVDMLPELIQQQNGRFVLFFTQLIAVGAGITVVTAVELAISH